MSRPPDNPGPQVSPAKRLRFRLEYAVIRSAVWIIPKLPGPLIRLMANLTGTLAWACDKRGRKNGMENLRCAFGERYDLAGRRRILQSSYRIFARTFFELFWSPRLWKREIGDMFFLDTRDPVVLEAVRKNHCLFISPHTGGFELLGVAKALGNWGSMTIAQDFKNPPLTALFQHLRSAGGRQPIIPQEGAMLRILKHLKKGGSAAALVDLTMKPDQGAVILKTFGMLTSVSHFHCALAQRTGVPILLFYSVPVKGGRRAIRFFDPVFVKKGDDLQAVAQRCWDAYEPMIREHPQQWLWMYKHWRYLPPGAKVEDYPEYARRHADFDALLAAQQAVPADISS